MRYTLIALILFLSACSEYQPVLTSPPDNKAQYTSDLQECRDQAKPSNGAETAMLAGGLIGLAIHDSMNPGSNDFTSEKTIVQKCLTDKGYNLSDTPVSQ